MDLKNLYKRVGEFFRKSYPEEVCIVGPPSADELRRRNLERYKGPDYPHCYFAETRAEIKKQVDTYYNRRAYEIMTDEEILMSDERATKLRHDEISDLLRDLRKIEEESREVEILVNACAA